MKRSVRWVATCGAISAIATVLGCNAQVRTSGVGSSGRGGPRGGGGGGDASQEAQAEPEERPTSRGPVANGNDPGDDQRVIDLFAKFDWKMAKSVEAEGTGWYFSNHVKTKPLFHPYKIASPDPDWIPGWSSVQAMRLDDAGWEALAQAAVNRTWSAQCVADYGDWRAKNKVVDAAHRPELERLRNERNPYARIAGLTALRKKIFDEQSAAKPGFADGNPEKWSGIALEATLALFAAHRDGQRDFRLEHLAAVGRDPWAKLGHVLRDDAFERDFFCGHAMKHGTHATPALPRLGRGAVMAAVKQPVSKERLESLESALAAERAATAKALAIETHRIPTLESGSSADPKEPKLQLLERFEVVSVGAGSLELVKKHEGSFPYDCVRTNRVSRVLDDGRVEYEESCKHGTSEHTVYAHVTIADLPPDLKKGDELSLYGDVGSKTEKKLANTASLVSDRADYAITGRHVAAIWRGGKALAAY